MWGCCCNMDNSLGRMVDRFGLLLLGWKNMVGNDD